jgi:hypothetical protein
MENIASRYLNELPKSTNPGNLLVKMLLELFDNVHFSPLLIKAVNRSIKVYGRYDTYWALLKLTTIQKVNFNGYLYPLISAIIIADKKKKGYREASEDVNEYAEDIIKKIEKIKNKDLELENPFDE